MGNESLRQKGLMGYDENLKLSYIYDTKTKNISFLQTAKDLSRLGVKNNKFFLKLYDTKLIGVNPFDPLISPETAARIVIECVRNPWYYLREIARIPEQGASMGPGSGSVFQLHRANLAAIYLYLLNINFYLVIPRQCGKTVSITSILLWTYIFGTSNSVMSFINKKQEDANENLLRLKQQKSILPLFMQQRMQFIDGTFKNSTGENNVQSMTNSDNGNRIVTKPSARTIASAENVGRGTTSPLQWFDEAEFTSFFSYIWKASGPAFVQAARTAYKNHAPYCRIITTTPGNIDSEPVEGSNDIRENSTRWSDKLFDLNTNELIAYLKKNSPTWMFYIQFAYSQIGKNEEWFQSQCRELSFDRVRIKREILLQRIRGTTDSPFDLQDLDALNGIVRHPTEEVLLNRIFTVRLYEKINQSIPYIVGMDVSTATNKDNTAITIIDPYTERAVGEFKSPLIDVVDICTFVRLLVKKIVPRCILCIERNSLGDAVIAMLKRTEVAPRLYYDSEKYIAESTDAKLDEKGFLKQEAENRRYHGVYTSGKSRELMIAILMRYVAEKKDCLATEYLVQDINNLIKKASGKIEARSDTHDDCIMSYLIGMFVLIHGTKLYRWDLVRGKQPPPEQPEEETYESIYEYMPKEMQDMFQPPQPKMDPYQEELRKAMIEMQKTRDNFSESDMAVVTRDDNFSEEFDIDDQNDYPDLEFFKEINS